MKTFGAVVLAAGESKRMGQPKQLLPWGGDSVIGTVTGIALAAPVARVVVVLGHAASRVARAIGQQEPQLRLVRNSRHREGMLTSVQAGVAALPADTEAFFLFLGDQPLVSPRVAWCLADAYGPEQILLPVHGGRRGHPILISCRYREEILGLDPAVGLRQLLRNHPGSVREVAVSDPGIHIDLDSEADYERYRPG